MNLGKSGASLSIGHRGLWHTIGHHRRRVPLGLPETGLYWTETAPPAPQVHAGHKLDFAAAIVGGLILLYWLAQVVQ